MTVKLKTWCERCHKWAGPAAVPAGANTDHLCKCLTPEQESILSAIPGAEVQRLSASPQGVDEEAMRLAEDMLDRNVWNKVGPKALMEEAAATLRRLAARVQELEAASAPIDMVLFCPKCGTQHIDAPETDAQYTVRLHESSWWECGGDKPERWTNPPHRSHLCHGCKNIWRPADVPTNGVLAVKTKGKNDSPIAQPEACAHAVPQGWVKKMQQLASDTRKMGLEVFDSSETPQVVRDALEWFCAEMTVEIPKLAASTASPAPTLDVEKERRDAERYRWMKANVKRIPLGWELVGWDAAIDAARAQKESK